MIRKIAFSLLSVAFVSTAAFGYNELQRLEINPRFTVINSSALADENISLLLNPAGLSRLDRMNMTLSTANFLNIGYLGFTASVPVFGGGFGLGIFNIENLNKRGIVAGWGKDLTGWFSMGFSLKTVSTNYIDLGQGILFDAGLLFVPNETLGGDFFKNRFINNKIFISMVIQNLGKQPSVVQAEDMDLRLGIAYYLQPLWTKLFFEKNLLTRDDLMVFGLEFRPEDEVLKFLSLRVSYDMQDIRAGASINGEDARLDVSYDFTRPQLYFSLTGYFEKNRSEQSKDYYDDGMVLLAQAQDMERQGNDKAYIKYRQAYDRFNTALGFDRNNRKAAYRISQIGEKISDFQSAFLDNAHAAEQKNDSVSAIMNYRMANQVADSPEANKKIPALSTNKDTLSYVATKKNQIKNLMRARKHVSARREIDKLLLVVPDDRDARSMDGENRGRLNAAAQRYLNQAQDRYNRAQYEECITRARYALAYNSELERASELIDMATTQLGTKRGIEKAYEQFRQKEYMASLRLANWILDKNPRSAQAIELRLRILKIFKQNWKRYLDMGLKHYNNSDYDKAVEEFDKVLLADPGNSVATEYRNRAASKMSAMEKLEGLGEDQ